MTPCSGGWAPLDRFRPDHSLFGTRVEHVAAIRGVDAGTAHMPLLADRASIILRPVALVDRRKVGFNPQVFAHIKLNTHGHVKLGEFTSAISGFEELLECYVLMGFVDPTLRLVASDIHAYERSFFEKLYRLPGIQEINSTVALSEIKATTMLPV